MKSVVYQLQSDHFPRIRIGIGSQKKGDLVDFVIGGFSKEEVPVLEETVTKAVSAIECILAEDVDIAMNRYNTKKARPKKEEHE